MLLHTGLKGDERWYSGNHGEGPLLLALWRHYLHLQGLDLDVGDRVKDYPRGGIVGIATITDVVRASEDPWFVGPYGWVLQDIHPLPFIPCRGKPRMFSVGRDVLALIEPEVLR